jgi:hypothetical protein
MLTKVKVALSAAIALGTAFPAWAACSTTHPPFAATFVRGQPLRTTAELSLGAAPCKTACSG